MKKFFAAVLAMTVGAGAFAATENYVYDYRASFKRIDAQYKARKINGVPHVTEQYAVKNDSLAGYVILPKCQACLGNGAENEQAFNGKNQVAYLVRRGDKYARKNGLKFVYKVKADAEVNTFGAYVLHNGVDTNDNPLKRIEDAKKAWMGLTFTFVTPDDDSVDVPGTKVVNGVTSPYPMGVYGIDNNMDKPEADLVIYNSGFGVVKSVSDKGTNGTPNIGDGCTPGETPGRDPFACQYIYSVNGSMVGNAYYLGTCNVTPMWDLCYPAANEEMITAQKLAKAGVNGTWTLRYNKSLTDKADDMKEKEIYKKLKADENGHDTINSFE